MVIDLYQETYFGFWTYSKTNEKLFEIDKIKISTSTLRTWLIKDPLWKKERKGRKHRHWRERKAYLGEMVQMDGSHHDWLEGRGPKMVIMA
ncbi:MAG: hypothetical protein V2A53_10235 [bacterium]